MNVFEHALLRLKEQLKIQTDKEVASLLGISATAFADRKKRNSFPDEKLRALAQQRPDLGIDVMYVLTGRTAEFDRRLGLLKEATEQSNLEGLSEGARARLQEILLFAKMGDVESLEKTLAPADLDPDTRHAIEMAGDELLRQKKMVSGEMLVDLVESGRRYIRHVRELERRKAAEAKEEAPHETRRRKTKIT